MRTKQSTKSVSAILTADWHLREDTPVCRTDNYFRAQDKVMQFICDLQQEHNCPVLVAGDIFDKWKASPFLISWAIKHFPENMIVVPGQHDLQNHNINLYGNTALNVLEKAGKVKGIGKGFEPVTGDSTMVYGYAWGEEPAALPEKDNSKRNIAVCHIMTWTNKVPFPGCNADSAHALLKKMSGYDLVVTGDNHQPFVVEHKGRMLVNPGSMMQMTADQMSHRPRVYLWYAKDNSVQPVYLPSFANSISREHIDKVEERDKRIDAFVSRLKDDFEVGLSFSQNLEEYFSKNKTEKEVKDLVMKAVEE